MDFVKKTVDDEKYRSIFLQKSKKNTQQGSEM